MDRDAARWDAEYQAGKHDRYDGLHETARIGIAAGYAARLAAGGAVLDAGAGAAVLAPLLSGPNAPRRYAAFDLSQTAVARGEEKLRNLSNGPAEAEIRQASVENYEPEENAFDLIVFNEVLFFVADAPAQLERYRAGLRPGGAILISLHLPKRPESGAHAKFATLWSHLESAWTTLDEVTLWSVTKDNTWRLRLVAPSNPNRAG